jgi:hypothetical protein
MEFGALMSFYRNYHCVAYMSRDFLIFFYECIKKDKLRFWHTWKHPDKHRFHHFFPLGQKMQTSIGAGDPTGNYNRQGPVYVR